jgi:hypothetical protein
VTTAVQDRAFPSSSDDGLTKLKDYLRIPASDTSDDTVLELALESAKEQADQYLQNPFEDADGNAEDIPSQVEMGVLVHAATIAFREQPEIQSKSGEYSESFRLPTDALHETQQKYWGSYRQHPGGWG